MHSVPSVKSSLDPYAISERFQSAGQAAGFRLERFGEAAGGLPLFALTKRALGLRPRIYLSAGIHGDEPAPPLALLHLLERGFFDERATWFLCPLLNPLSFAAGLRTNADGHDLNRDYRTPRFLETRGHVAWLQRQPRFDLTLCVHEDWEATGFYLYELRAESRPALAEPIIEAVRAVFPIDAAAQIDGRPAHGGIIRPEIDPEKRELWSEAVYLRAHHAPLVYTLETPSSFPMEKRVAAHCAAIETAIAEFLARR